jgi:hypothetical protein
MTPLAEPVLDKPPPPPTTKGPSVGAIVIFAIITALLWFVVAFLVIFEVPRFAKLFADFQALIPVQSDWVAHEAWWIAPVCLLVALLCCIASAWRRIGLALLILMPLTLILLIVVGIYLPYAELLDALGSKAPDL